MQNEPVTHAASLPLARSMELYERAVTLIPGETQTMSRRPSAYALGRYPIYADRAQGSHVWDVDGNEYVDYVLACGPIVLGYNHPRVRDAIARQLERGTLFGLLSPLEVQAAEAIVGAVPCAEMVRFFKGGVEANSAAVRIARAVTGREKVATSGYRGWHDQWAIADEGQRRGVPRGLAEYTLPFPYGDGAALRALFDRNPGQIAAIILEPATVDGAAPEFLADVRALASAQGAVLIFDEVVTGFRLALGGAQEYFRVVPDLAVFAKALANGMPLAAVVGQRELMRVAEELFITLTYGDESLSLAAAVATLAELRAPAVHAHLWTIGHRLMEGLNVAAREACVPFASRGFGPMSRLALDATVAKQWDALPADVWSYLLAAMARRGVLWRPGGVTFVTSAHTEEDVDYTVRMAAEAFRELRQALDADRVAGTSQGQRAARQFQR